MRANAGAGVEIIQMDFSSKGYGAKREFNFATNCKKINNAQNDMSTDALLRIACDVIFTQMSQKDEQKKYAQMTTKAGIEKFGQAAVVAIVN